MGEHDETFEDAVVSEMVVKDAKTGAVVNAPPVEKAPASGSGRLTFEMYAAVRRIPVQRRPGMKAFTTTKHASLEEWDVIFSSY